MAGDEWVRERGGWGWVHGGGAGAWVMGLEHVYFLLGQYPRHIFLGGETLFVLNAQKGV